MLTYVICAILGILAFVSVVFLIKMSKKELEMSNDDPEMTIALSIAESIADDSNVIEPKPCFKGHSIIWKGEHAKIYQLEGAVSICVADVTMLWRGSKYKVVTNAINERLKGMHDSDIQRLLEKATADSTIGAEQ